MTDEKIKTVFTTERAEVHQQTALEAAPPELDITMLRNPDAEALKSALADAVYLISERTGTINADILSAAPKLKMVQRLGRLTHDIDTEAAEKQGVAVAYFPDPGVIRVAEHVMMQMLVLLKRTRQVEKIALKAWDGWGESERTDEDTFAYNWARQDNIHSLWRKKIGIVGFGEIAAELSSRLQGWGCTILYNKRRRLPERIEDEFGLLYTDKDRLFESSDIVVNLLPYFPTTDMSINAAAFDRMKPGTYIVSAGSGSVIDEKALAFALQTGKLAGAALDTFEYEPIRADNPLINLAESGYNVLLTPHTAAVGAAPSDDDRRAIYANLMRHHRHEPLKYRVV